MLFVSFSYSGRLGKTYDQGFDNMIMDGFEEPQWNDDLERLTEETTNEYKSLKRFEFVFLTILFFKKVGT